MTSHVVFRPESAADAVLQTASFQELDKLYCSGGGAVGEKPIKPKPEDEEDDE